MTFWDDYMSAVVSARCSGYTHFRDHLGREIRRLRAKWVPLRMSEAAFKTELVLCGRRLRGRT